MADAFYSISINRKWLPASVSGCLNVVRSQTLSAKHGLFFSDGLPLKFAQSRLKNCPYLNKNGSFCVLPFALSAGYNVLFKAAAHQSMTVCGIMPHNTSRRALTVSRVFTA